MGSVQFSPIIEMMGGKLHMSFISSLGGLIRQTVCSKFTLMALNELQEVLVKPHVHHLVEGPVYFVRSEKCTLY